MRLNSFFGLGLMIWIAFVQCEKNQKIVLRPNFIIFIADDVSWDDLSVYGNDFVKTPNINSLSTEGLVFKNMYLTTSSCSPSRN